MARMSKTKSKVKHYPKHPEHKHPPKTFNQKDPRPVGSFKPR